MATKDPTVTAADTSAAAAPSVIASPPASPGPVPAAIPVVLPPVPSTPMPASRLPAAPEAFTTVFAYPKLKAEIKALAANLAARFNQVLPALHQATGLAQQVLERAGDNPQMQEVIAHELNVPTAKVAEIIQAARTLLALVNSNPSA